MQTFVIPHLFRSLEMTNLSMIKCLYNNAMRPDWPLLPTLKSH